MPGFPFANNAEGTCSDRATIPRKERQKFNSKQRVKVLNLRRTCKTLQSLIYFIKTKTSGDRPFCLSELIFVSKVA